jgi:NADP-dependent 3-hydroxy acid dehydrogenase YdfG
MDLIIQNDGLFQLVPLTKQMMEHMSLLVKVDCMDLCEIIRIKLTTYADSLNLHVMNNGSGNFYGCICN